MGIRPKVDIILCCYNQERFIGEAVNSIIRQKIDADVRVLVADDSSPDSTLEIIKRLEVESPFQFDYLQSDHNIGFVANYQRAFAACRGDYVAILEGDDRWETADHLAQHVNFLEHHPHFSMSFNRMYYYFQENGRKIVHSWPYKNDFYKLKLRDTIVYGNQIGNLSACCFRRKFLQMLPEIFFEHYIADWEIGMIMASHGPIGRLKKPTSLYRINNMGQWSGMDKKAMLRSQFDTLKLMKPFLPKYCLLYYPLAKRNIKRGIDRPYPRSWKTKIKEIKSKIRIQP